MPAATSSVVQVIVADDHPLVRDGLRALLDPEDDLEVTAEAEDYDQLLERVGSRALHRLRPASCVHRLSSTEKPERLEIATAIVGALEIDDRGFVPEFSVWATNPF